MWRRGPREVSSMVWWGKCVSYPLLLFISGIGLTTIQMIPKVKTNVQNSAFVQYRKPSTHYFAVDNDIPIMENNLAFYVTSPNIYKLLNIYNCTEQHVILIYFVYRVCGAE